MTPFALHVPKYLPPAGTLHNICAGPPVAATLLSLPSAKNPMSRLSGDQKVFAPVMPSVLGIPSAAAESSGRTQI